MKVRPADHVQIAPPLANEVLELRRPWHRRSPAVPGAPIFFSDRLATDRDDGRQHAAGDQRDDQKPEQQLGGDGDPR